MNPQPQIVGKPSEVKAKGAKPNEVMPSEADLIDRIAELLPSEQRPLWYREMAHLRRLPADDEMLRIAHAMGFLALVTRQAPEEMAKEREQLTAILDRSVTTILAAESNVVALHQRLEARLAQLPEEITSGISPEAIAGKISESLRQQFVASGIPETAHSLAAVAKQNKQTAADFDQTAKQLTHSYQGAVTNAHHAIGEMRTAMTSAAETVQRSANSLVRTFLGHYKWALHWLLVFGIALGFVLCLAYVRWSGARSETTQPVPSSVIPPSPQSANPNPSIAPPTRKNRPPHKPSDAGTP